MAWETWTTDWIEHDPVERTRGIHYGPGHVYPFTNQKPSWLEEISGEGLVKQEFLVPPLRFEDYAINNAWSNQNLGEIEPLALSTAVNQTFASYPPSHGFDDNNYFERVKVSTGIINVADSDNYGWCEWRADQLASTFVPPEGGELGGVTVEWEGWESGEPLGTHSDRVLRFFIQGWTVDSSFIYRQEGDGWYKEQMHGDPPTPAVDLIRMTDLRATRYYNPQFPDQIYEESEYQCDWTPDYDGDGIPDQDVTYTGAYEWTFKRMREYGDTLLTIPRDEMVVELPISDSTWDAVALYAHKRYSYNRVARYIPLRLVPRWEGVSEDATELVMHRTFGITPNMTSTYQPPRYRITYDVFVEDPPVDPEPETPVITGSALAVRRRFT